MLASLAARYELCRRSLVKDGGKVEHGVHLRDTILPQDTRLRRALRVATRAWFRGRRGDWRQRYRDRQPLVVSNLTCYDGGNVE